MKNILSLSLVLAIAFSTFAQCNPATIKDMPTVYSKVNSTSSKFTAEQAKYFATVFTSVIEPALKNTKGLKGKCSGLDSDWEYSGGMNGTPDGLTSTTIQMYMSLMGCTKDKKIHEIDETGLVINFDLNSLHFISKMSENETYRNDKKVFLPNKIAGCQIFELNKSTPSDKYASLTFYRQTDNAKYFLITKKGIPFFTPVTIKQALELFINNMTEEIAKRKKQASSTTILSKEVWVKKEGVQPMESLTAKQVKELNDAGYQAYVEGSNQVIQGSNFYLDMYKKNIEMTKEFLKTATAATLGKQATVIFLAPFIDIADLRQSADESPQNNLLMTLDNNYLNLKLPKAAPQFICVELRAQGNDAVTGKAFQNFEENLDFIKLEKLLAR